MVPPPAACKGALRWCLEGAKACSGDQGGGLGHRWAAVRLVSLGGLQQQLVPSTRSGSPLSPRAWQPVQGRQPAPRQPAPSVS